jgi:DNA-sulfur modification-associated
MATSLLDRPLKNQGGETVEPTVAGIEELSKGTPIPCLVKHEYEADVVVPVPLLFQLAPSPMLSENPRAHAIDARLQEVASLRHDVQRAFTGAKAKNVRSYASYIDKGLKGEQPLGLPAIHLWHPRRLSYVAYPSPSQRAIIWPFGDIGVAIDGETQLEAWIYVVNQLRNPSAHERKVSVTIHHGKPIAEVRELFYLFNVMEVKPTASIAINMDPRDPATQITREVIAKTGWLTERVSMGGRSATGNEITTLAALRTAMVTTIKGRGGLQVGSRRVEVADAEYELVRRSVIEIWTKIFEALHSEFDQAKQDGNVVSAPAVLAGIGAVAHHAMPQPPRDPSYDPWTVDQLVGILRDVNWKGHDGFLYPWDGVGGRINPKSGTFSPSGPKEVGHQIAFALENPDSEGGQRIRAKSN